MSKAPRTTHDDFQAIDRYVAATFERFRRALVAQLPTFVEPRAADPDRALRRLGFLVETLTGFAIGASIGAVATAVRRGFGAEVSGGIGRVLGRVMHDGASRVVVTDLLTPAAFLGDPDRPLLDALGAQLHARLCAALPVARAHVALVHAELTRQAPARLRAFADMLDLLAGDDAPALAFADQLAAGWRSFAVAVGDGARGDGARGDGSRAADDSAAGSAITDAAGTWRAWTLRLSGRPEAAAPTHEEIVAQGFVVRIA